MLLAVWMPLILQRMVVRSWFLVMFSKLQFSCSFSPWKRVISMSFLEMLKWSFSFCGEQSKGGDTGVHGAAHQQKPRGNSPHARRATYEDSDFQFCVHLGVHPVACESGVFQVLQGATVQVGVLDSQLHGDVRTHFGTL